MLVGADAPWQVSGALLWRRDGVAKGLRGTGKVIPSVRTMPSFFSRAVLSRLRQPRSERLDLNFPVEFFGAGVQERGTCQNISASGLLAHFPRPIEIWTNGELWCNTGMMILELKVRIVRVQEQEIGMMFQFRDDREREAVLLVVASASADMQRAGFGGTPL